MPYHRLDQLVDSLEKLEIDEELKIARVKLLYRNVKPSKAQRDFKKYVNLCKMLEIVRKCWEILGTAGNGGKQSRTVVNGRDWLGTVFEMFCSLSVTDYNFNKL